MSGIKGHNRNFKPEEISKDLELSLIKDLARRICVLENKVADLQEFQHTQYVRHAKYGM